MKPLQDLARQLLEAGEVKVVVGYEAGRRGVRPVFITRPDDVERLIFDHRCVHNLATYIGPRRGHVKRLGRAAVVLKGCDARAVAGLIRESQIAREDVVLIGVRCGGVVDTPDHGGELTAATIAPRCHGCTVREPSLPEHVVGELPPAPPVGRNLDADVARLMAMSAADRLAFWTRELDKCVRCYACRQVCPLCVCERCIVDKTQPRWIEPSAHARGNMAWHLTRAQHLAGRCSGCSECERACPEGIPVHLFNHVLAGVVRDAFGCVVSDDPEVSAPVGVFRKDDAEEFIV
jgi:formate dehydrogenase (coenzyme F420) beta subunit